MNTNIFTAVRAAVTARQAAELYGLKVGRDGMACCPFHGDKHPSMKVDERYYCFGCHETGSVIDFTAKLFGLTPLEAARKLAADFHLDPDAPAPAAVPSKWQLEARQRDREARCTQVLTAYERLLKRRKDQYSPATPDRDFDPRCTEVCRQLAGIGHFLDLLGQPDAQTRRETAEALIRCGAVDRLEAELAREKRETGGLPDAS